MSLANLRLLITTCFILSFSLAHQNAIALASDSEQPINVSANSAQKDSNEGITIYDGNVVIIQGSIRITGDNFTIYDEAGTVSKITATGSPASFKQKPDINSKDMIATGLLIEYDIDKETLLLEDDALLKQQGRTTESNHIEYNMKTTIVNAGGDDDGRVIMVLEPK